MSDKRTLLPGLAVLGCLAFSLPVYAQYSTPMRDIDNPGRTPFVFWSQVNPLTLNGFTNVVITSLPVGATQRLVVDFANVTLSVSSGTLQTDPLFLLTVINVSTNTPAYNLYLPVAAVNGNQIAIGSQPIQVYVSAGQKLVFGVNNNATLGNSNATLAFSGHFVNLP
jgi:hypothetical protein